jgi:hypothetical protein
MPFLFTIIRLSPFKVSSLDFSICIFI